MKKSNLKTVIGFISLGIIISSGCKREPDKPPHQGFSATPYQMDFPARFPQSLFHIPADNPLTVEGIALGKKLFFDPRLSGDNTLSCSGCHFPEQGFADGIQFSTGIDGLKGDRNGMTLFNLAFYKEFFWNGRSHTLEQQIIEPVINPIEMHDTWKNAIDKLSSDQFYRDMFNSAFGVTTFDSIHVAKAMAQFLRTIISGNSRFQQGLNQLTAAEKRGFNIFQAEDKGDCTHCHPADVGLFTDNYFIDIAQRFHNNGLLPDLPPGTFIGRSEYTKKMSDNGMFKSPSLLNLAFTAPYMHDGRFNTLEEVVNFYDSGVHMNSNLDNNLGPKAASFNRTFQDGKRNLNLTEQEKADLVSFLKCLTDSTFLMNPAYRE